MASTRKEATGNAPLHVLIAGAGVVGLTIAQGCRQNGISYSIFERDEHRASRPQGWAVTLHWCLNSLRRTIGPELAQKIPETAVDTTSRGDAGNFLFLNAETGEVRYKVPPTKERFRLNRPKLLALLSTEVDVQWGKCVASYEDLQDKGVKVNFDDGSSVVGSMLVGADGNNSNVRKCLFQDEAKASLNALPINVTGVVRHFTPEEGFEPRAIDPLLFMGLHPQTCNYFWYSLQDVFEEPNGRLSFDALVLMSWPIKDEKGDAIPATNRLRIANMKERAKEMSAPIRRLFDGIPDDTERVAAFQLADFATLDWEPQAKVTLAGDSAHAMTMYRGEGANHGILDAALLIDQLIKVQKGDVGQQEALARYEKEMKVRGQAAVLKSRTAALDGHHWDLITDDCALIGGRWAPETA
ncbi:hypothetical protein B0J14DRAFT_223642 [Halenospora varia]|nr:hypothetical protein B0J14DRAFT_223642 [Halenospora varia]